MVRQAKQNQHHTHPAELLSSWLMDGGRRQGVVGRSWRTFAILIKNQIPSMRVW